MLRVPQNHPGRKQRGRRSGAISSLPTPSSFASPSLLRQLTPLLPLHPRKSPVTPLFPLLTQKQGGGGVFCKMCSPITLLFSMAVLTMQLRIIVGAPTFLFLHSFRRSLGRHASSAISKHELFKKPKSTDRSVCATERRNPKPRHTCRSWGTRFAGHGELF